MKPEKFNLQVTRNRTLSPLNYAISCLNLIETYKDTMPERDDKEYTQTAIILITEEDTQMVKDFMAILQGYYHHNNQDIQVLIDKFRID